MDTTSISTIWTEDNVCYNSQEINNSRENKKTKIQAVCSFMRKKFLCCIADKESLREKAKLDAQINSRRNKNNSTSLVKISISMFEPSYSRM